MDTYPHQCSFLHRTSWFARQREVMEDNLVGREIQKHFHISNLGCSEAWEKLLAKVPFWGPTPGRELLSVKICI